MLLFDWSCFCWQGKCSVCLVSGLTERPEIPRARGTNQGSAWIGGMVLLCWRDLENLKASPSQYLFQIKSGSIRIIKICVEERPCCDEDRGTIPDGSRW
jgi:hypothetical protein